MIFIVAYIFIFKWYNILSPQIKVLSWQKFIALIVPILSLYVLYVLIL